MLTLQVCTHEILTHHYLPPSQEVLILLNYQDVLSFGNRNWCQPSAWVLQRVNIMRCLNPCEFYFPSSPRWFKWSITSHSLRNLKCLAINLQQQPTKTTPVLLLWQTINGSQVEPVIIMSSGRLFAKGMLRSHILIQRTKKRMILPKAFHLIPSVNFDTKSKVGKVFQFYKLGGQLTYVSMCPHVCANVLIIDLVLILCWSCVHSQEAYVMYCVNLLLVCVLIDLTIPHDYYYFIVSIDISWQYYVTLYNKINRSWEWVHDR